ncbi:fumarylacetoacetate hydrolase family protein [Sphingomonas sp. SRS2]|uniref:fumarylacetoacetate hydrolase family protein n=1 Tax=Sphingomonas sp. SRS2 TaxID=133190 RepID=UPI00061844DE|nr:fumarylacetoacetate hydrolase family protein [Sphingomonas sp. SRS2]KKC23927.1 2-hydroxyhepta-2,4-diene-1,7-dioate isomerase [Sphingomonas sp. SRS2]
MKLCRFDDNRLGVVEGDMVRDVSAALGCLPTAHYPLPTHDLLIALLPQVREAIEAMNGAGAVRPLSEVRLLSPVANPAKLVAAPVNYRAHIEEVIANEATFTKNHGLKIRETGLFLKANSSLIGAGSPILIHHDDRRTDHEIELAVVIGQTCRDVSADKALAYVAGYAIGLDITIRGPEERSLRKSLDTYSVLGPWLVTADEFGDPTARDLLLTVGDETRQKANTRDLILDVPALIEFASSFYTLHPGDVIFTGTPEGVGPITPGDRIRASITGVGAMDVDVVSG